MQDSVYGFRFQTMAVLLPTAAVSFKSNLCTNEIEWFNIKPAELYQGCL